MLQVTNRIDRRSAGHSTELDSLMREYLRLLTRRGYDHRVVMKRQRYLQHFIDWAEAHGVTKPSQIDEHELASYGDHLYQARNRTGTGPIGIQLTRCLLASLRGWLTWLHEDEHTQRNLAPKVPKAKRDPVNMTAPRHPFRSH